MIAEYEQVRPLKPYKHFVYTGELAESLERQLERAAHLIESSRLILSYVEVDVRDRL
jgi:hypothetical protein